MRRWIPSGVAESSATALESNEVEESWRTRLRKALLEGVTAAADSLGFFLKGDLFRLKDSVSSSGDDDEDNEEDTSNVM